MIIFEAISCIRTAISDYFTYRTTYKNKIFLRTIKKEPYDIVFLPNKQYVESPTCEIESLLGDIMHCFKSGRLHRFTVDRSICYGADFEDDTQLKNWDFSKEAFRNQLEKVFVAEYVTNKYHKRKKQVV